jgi:hypothetical protein
MLYSLILIFFAFTKKTKSTQSQRSYILLSNSFYWLNYNDIVLVKDLTMSLWGVKTFQTRLYTMCM